jgi:transcriptional regulator of PTS gene
VFAPNLGWKDFDLKTPLEKATRLPVELENAANSCALSEICFGRRAEGLRNLIVVTVSEGIGCGLILNHQLVQGSTGTAGEFGHATLIQDGLECSCGNRGCWEMYASNTAAIRHYTKAIAPTRPTKRPTKALGENEKTISFEHLLRLADQGDAKAVEALQQMAKYLGMGIAPLVTGLAPDMIVIVGEVTRAWREVGPIIKDTIKQQSFTRAETQIVPSDPITQPRLRGTIALVLLKHFGAPSIA